MNRSTSDFITAFRNLHGVEILEMKDLICSQHGHYQNSVIKRTYADGTVEFLPLSGCPVCRKQSVMEVSLLETKDMTVKQLIDKIGIPERFSEVTVSGFIVADINEAAMRMKTLARHSVASFVKGDILSLVLIGKTGTGKSHLIIASLKALARDGMTALYCTEKVIYREIHESFLGRKNLMTESQIIKKYSEVDVLGIDELGRSSWTDHEAQTLYEIIDNRYMNNKKTIVGGNMTLEDLRNKFDTSIIRKLEAQIVVCNWDEYRIARVG